jgi:hypothetical protein
MAKKLVFTTNDPGASTDYAAADGTWKTIPSGTTGGGIKHAATSGTDTYTASITGVTSYADGDAYLIRFTTGNTTSCTLNINSLGAKSLYRNNDGALIGGDIVDGAEMLCIYNSTLNAFQVIGTAPNTLLAYVTNAETTTITKGQPVYAFGGQGDRLKVKLAYNTSDATSAQTVGFVLSSSIAANQKGLIIVNGQLDGLNMFPTSTWADGDAVYLGATAGSVTKTKPVAPNHLVYLGFVTTANNGSAGRMYVRVQNGYEMDELHNVSAVSPANNDILKYNTSTSLWEKSNVLSTKQDTITGAATTITSSNLTASRALESDSSGKVGVSTVTRVELGYLSGVTSAIQTQLNAKQGTLSVTTTGTSGAATLVGSTLNIPQYAGAGSGASMQLVAGSTTALAAGTTRYGNVAGSTSESQQRTPVTDACTMNNLYIRTTATMPANSSLAVTIFKNGAATAVTRTIAAGSVAGTYSDTSNNATFAAGDGWNIEYKNVGSAAAAPSSGTGFKITI